jgi:hypothetical protein
MLTTPSTVSLTILDNGSFVVPNGSIILKTRIQTVILYFMYTRSQGSNVPTVQQHTSQDSHRLDIPIK